MERNQYVVYRVTDPETGERQEMSAHLSERKAQDMADRYHEKDGGCYAVDVDYVSITRAGREVLDSTADIYVAGTLTRG